VSGYPDVSMRRQCELLGIHRSGLYYKPVGPDPYDQQLMVLIDQMYTKRPFYGSRKMTHWLRKLGHEIGRKRVQRLMRTMGLEAIYPRRRTTIPNPAHKVRDRNLDFAVIAVFRGFRLPSAGYEPSVKLMTPGKSCFHTLGHLTTASIHCEGISALRRTRRRLAEPAATGCRAGEHHLAAI